MDNTTIKFDKNIKKDKNIIAILNFEFNSENGNFSFYLNPILENQIKENQEFIQENINEFKEMIKKNLDFNNYPFVII